MYDIFKKVIEHLKWIIFSLTLIALTVATYFEINKYPPNILTGKSTLLVIGPYIKLELKSSEAKTIGLQFSKPINERFVKVLNEDKQVMLRLNEEWLRISHINGQNLPEKIFFRIADPKGSLTVNRIENTYINGAEVNLYDFSTSHVALNPSQTSLRYNFSIPNIGNLFAKYIGVYVPTIIIWFLVPLSLVQLFALLADFVSFMPQKMRAEVKRDELDWITENLAIPFGLLGTVSALWTSFEFLNVDLGNIYSIIQILSAGLFTTFLGLFSYGLMKGRDMLVNYRDE